MQLKTMSDIGSATKDDFENVLTLPTKLSCGQLPADASGRPGRRHGLQLSGRDHELRTIPDIA